MLYEKHLLLTHSQVTIWRGDNRIIVTMVLLADIASHMQTLHASRQPSYVYNIIRCSHSP